MREKAIFLSELPTALAPWLAKTAPGVQALLEPALNAFAQGAFTALSLNSVFYMSALLYPDCPAPGDPNNLEKLIRDLRKRFSENP
jgi:hypothetical protein